MILKAKVHKDKGSSNPPVLMVLVDRVPYPHDMVYVVKKFSSKRTMFRSLAANGLVLYGIHNPNDPRDHSVTKLRDTEGVVHEFRGAWTSRASVMNKYFDKLPHIQGVLVTSSEKHFRQGYFSSAYSMEVVDLNKWLSANDAGWLLMPEHFEYAPDEPNYALVEVSKMENKIPHELHP